MTTRSAERLRKAREDAGFASAGEASVAHGWKAAGYRHHENGTQDYFDLSNALKCARAFSVDPAWLLGLAEDNGSCRAEPNLAALASVLVALFQAYAPQRQLESAQLLEAAQALKDTLDEMKEDTQVGLYPDRAMAAAKAAIRARRRVASEASMDDSSKNSVG